MPTEIVGFYMVSRRAILGFFAAVAASLLSTVTPNYASSGPDVSHFKLANGMEVVVIPDRRTPVVTHMVWYRVGSADEPVGKPGSADVL